MSILILAGRILFSAIFLMGSLATSCWTFHARIGSALIALFLISGTAKMHPFWNTKDPMMSQMHQAMFMKNVSMLGACVLIIASAQDRSV